MVLIVHMNVELFSHELFQLFKILRCYLLFHIILTEHAVYLNVLSLNVIVLLSDTEQVPHQLQFVEHVILFHEHPVIKMHPLFNSSEDLTLL